MLELAEARCKSQTESVGYSDGLSMEFENWRFNIRAPNAELLVRLYVESRGDEALMGGRRRSRSR